MSMSKGDLMIFVLDLMCFANRVFKMNLLVDQYK